ncbi:2-oxoglutarate-dependent dioxygenase DAO-like [Papaver somniferum]|uniref:2-oxoglutarate-dependent dioxygenase DAO-like n=1 Tax=Papaver somniferum TaxID=3469 RepID=UPI000E704A70|nr:2-oxoglutarate-dependent dioxygenase DAO-like [Papaver somniferum]
MEAVSIPVIDLQKFPGQSAEILKACKEWGCFRIINHGIPDKLMTDMKQVVRALFDRPLEIKRRNIDVIEGSGYRAPNQKNPLYEALGLYDMGSSEAVETFCTQLDASPQQREVIKSYSKALHELIMELCGKLAESMGLSYDLAKGWPCQFRINKYNFTQESIGSSGVQIHTDSGFLTVLQEDDCVGGLEVMDKPSGEYIAVDPLPRSLCVNLGDMATVWSNGAFCNIRHRVQCKQAAIRISIALFLLGPKEAVVEAPQVFVDSNHPRLYKPFTYEDLRKLRISTGLHAGEALELMRLGNGN